MTAGSCSVAIRRNRPPGADTPDEQEVNRGCARRDDEADSSTHMT
jgi:hypothetical protein